MPINFSLLEVQNQENAKNGDRASIDIILTLRTSPLKYWQEYIIEILPLWLCQREHRWCEQCRKRCLAQLSLESGTSETQQHSPQENRGLQSWKDYFQFGHKGQIKNIKWLVMPVQNSQFLKGEQVPSVSANKKKLAIKNFAICTETSYLRFSERRHANFKCLETYFPPILAWVRFAWQKSLIKIFTLAFCVILVYWQKLPTHLKYLETTRPPSISHIFHFKTITSQ